MWKKLLNTESDVALTFLRLTLGLVIFPHGAQKALGWFGGFDFEGTMGFLTGQVGLPMVIAFLVILIEFAGSLALIAGFMSRVAALGIGVVIGSAAYVAHLGNGFFMNWMGNQKGEGFEYHLLVVGMALALVIKGGGAFSVDRKLSQ